MIVLVDFRTEALDFVPDPIGWLLVGAGAASSSLPLCAWLARAAAVLSVSEAWLSFRTVIVDPATNATTDRCPVDVCSERVEYDDPIWNGPAEYVALIGWASMTWLLVELWLRRDTAWAIPDQTVMPSPWGQRRRDRSVT